MLRMAKKIAGIARRAYFQCHSLWELRHVKKTGNKNAVFGKMNVIYPENLSIGCNCSFNHNCYINALNPIELGSDVSVSAGASIISTGIDYKAWAAGNKGHVKHDGIKIGDHVWIGAGAQIVGNITISGEYVVVAAGAVVVDNIKESYCVVAGCPARIIKHFEDSLVQTVNTRN